MREPHDYDVNLDLPVAVSERFDAFRRSFPRSLTKTEAARRLIVVAATGDVRTARYWCPRIAPTSKTVDPAPPSTESAPASTLPVIPADPLAATRAALAALKNR